MKTTYLTKGVAAAAALAALLTACSGSDADDATSSPSEGASSTTASDAAAGDTPFPDLAGQSLTLATDPNYPPCQYFEDGSDEMVGFEVDIWDAVAERLGVELEVESTQFASLIPGVQSGRYDLAMECISDTEEREQQVSFVDYIYDLTVVVTTEDYDGPITSGDDLSLCGETMGAQSGFDTIETVRSLLNPECTEAGLPEVEILEYPSAADTYTALYSQRIDFILLGATAAAYVNESAPVQLVYNEIDAFPRRYLGAVLAQDSTELQEAIAWGMQAIVDDGTYEEILDTWGLSHLALLEPGINLATERPIG